jgi:toxin ParE1/3/4
MRRRAVPRDLEYLEEALEEAEAAARWYAERSANAAAGFSGELDAAEIAILEQPEAWPPFEHGTRRYLVRRYPLSVVYCVESSRVLIVAVTHARRRPGYWRARLPG